MPTDKVRPQQADPSLTDSIATGVVDATRLVGERGQAVAEAIRDRRAPELVGCRIVGLLDACDRTNGVLTMVSPLVAVMVIDGPALSALETHAAWAAVARLESAAQALPERSEMRQVLEEMAATLRERADRAEDAS